MEWFATRISTPKKTVKSFEILLDKYWENQEVKYDYNEEIKVKTGSHKKKFILDIDEEDADIQCSGWETSVHRRFKILKYELLK